MVYYVLSKPRAVCLTERSSESVRVAASLWTSTPTSRESGVRLGLEELEINYNVVEARLNSVHGMLPVWSALRIRATRIESETAGCEGLTRLAA